MSILIRPYRHKTISYTISPFSMQNEIEIPGLLSGDGQE